MLLSTVYKNYQIPENLQCHQLAVASIADEITRNWIGPCINQDSIIYCCLFHDIAKIINFNLSEDQLFTEADKDLSYWRRTRDNFVLRYGQDEKKATLSICAELGLAKEINYLIENLEWENIDQIIMNNSVESAICVYSDMRVGPKGIIKIQDRIIERAIRVNEQVDTTLLDKARNLEDFLQIYTTINLNGINNSIIQKKTNRFLSSPIPPLIAADIY